MQRIAAWVGFNETAFVFTSPRATRRLRFFTPGHEMPLCGHVTVASVFALFERGLLAERELPY
jgi:PhzF family phenazine biosynthesis protein